MKRLNLIRSFDSEIVIQMKYNFLMCFCVSFIVYSYNASPAPESHCACVILDDGSLAPRKQRLVVRTSVIANRERTKPHTSEYVRFHLEASRDARRFVAESASTPRNPSTENTRGVK